MKKKNIKPDELCFSVVNGRGVYKIDEELTSSPLPGIPTVLMVTSELSEERFFLKKLSCKEKEKERYLSLIAHPPKKKSCLWPVDMVRMELPLWADCPAFVANYYSDEEREKETGDMYGLLFPYDGLSNLVTWDQAIASACGGFAASGKNKNWKNPNIRRFARELIDALCDLNDEGYLYFDFHTSRFFPPREGNGQLLLDFSNLIYSAESLKKMICAPRSGDYPVEYAEPAYVRGTNRMFDRQTQNYNLCAFLFHLFYGRYAYEGYRMAEHHVEPGDLLGHYSWFYHYYAAQPIFVFDPENDGNRIGLYESDEIWTSSPEELRSMFVRTLSTESAERQRKIGLFAGAGNPEPAEWKECFRRCGWVE